MAEIDDVKIVDKYPADEITVSMVRHSFPRKLFRAFEEAGFKINKKYPGIYYIDGYSFFKIQVIVTKELSHEDGKWLRSLHGGIGDEEMSQILGDMLEYRSPENIGYLNALLDVIASANKDALQNWKEMSGMGGALAEIMKPELMAAKKEGKDENITQIVRNMVAKGYEYRDIVDVTGVSDEGYRYIVNAYQIDKGEGILYPEIDMTKYYEEKKARESKKTTGSSAGLEDDFFLE